MRGVYLLLECLVEWLEAAPCATYKEREDRLAAVFHPVFHALLAWQDCSSYVVKGLHGARVYGYSTQQVSG